MIKQLGRLGSLILGSAVGLGLGVAAAVAGDDNPSATEILAATDEVRLPHVGLEMRLDITPVRDGEAEETSRYQLFWHSEGDALLRALNRDQRGQKILATKKGTWFFAPRTKRAIRITPLQALRGEASIGDILRQRWSEDYDAAFAEQPQVELDGILCWQLLLTARSSHASYAKVKLYAAVESPRPVRAELHVASGRLFKIVLFEAPQRMEGRDAVTTTTLIDAIDTGKQTIVSVSGIVPRDLPKSSFTVRALTGDP